MQAKCTSALALAMLAILSFSSAVLASDLAADALPTGGQVVAGQATISQSAATMNVDQTSQRAVVNWQGFNVGANAQVNFNQPNAQAVTLNRVTGSGASQIDGAVRANGQVIIVNSNGVSFGKGAQVDAAAVVATTMNISNQDFMDGKHVYQGNGTGKVVNEGRITAHDAKGFIALLAPEVRNEGYLIARANVANTIAMAAGEKITLNFQNNQLIGVRVDVSTVNALVENKRLVFVDGGTVIVAANSARQLMNGVVRNIGVMVASSAVNNGGKIELIAAEVTNTGKLLANGKGTGATGGQINVAGENIVLAAGSKIAANGDAGGGQINVGSKAANASNNEPALTAKNVRVESTAIVSASAINSGNGGTVQIHSTEQTQIHGVISANGGPISGNGGVVQTSSNGTLVVGSTAQINVAATNGQSGTWKLQAGQLNIDRGMANVISQTLNQAHVALTAIAQNLFAGDIHQDTDTVIQKTAGANNTTLSLVADGEINIQGQIAGLLNTPLTVEMVANQIKLQSTANIAAYNIGVNAVSTLSIWGNLFGQGSNPFVNVLAGVFNLFGAISANNTNGQGGKVRVNANNIHLNSRSRIEANGQDGGEVILVASETIEIQNAEIQTNGSNGRGGAISVAGVQQNVLNAATLEATGENQGGKILIGNDAKNGTLPFSVYTSLDALTVINAGQINPNSLAGGFVETSGQTLGLLAAINAGRGGMWLLDPTNVTIAATAGTGTTSGNTTTYTNQTNISVTQIQTAINAGTNVTITADGTITVSSAIAFAPAVGVTGTFTLDNTSGTAQAIAINAAITNSGAGTVNFIVKASGSITTSTAGSITSSNGKINVLMQSFYATNPTANSGVGQNITLNAAITTRGGYVVLDGTGGSVSGTTITAGSILNGSIYTMAAAINTTNSGTTQNGPGGDVSITGSRNTAGIGAYEPGNVSTINAGGNVNINVIIYAGAPYGYVLNSYQTTSGITAYGDINILATGTSSGMAVSPLYISAPLVSTFGNIAITNNAVSNMAGVESLSTGTITALGTVSISSTTTTTQAINLAGAISSNAGITINGTSTTATNIVTLGAMTLGRFYLPGNNTVATVISSSAGAAGSLMGKLDTGASLPLVSGGTISGSSVLSGGGFSIQAASILSSTATSANYVIGFSDGTYTKIVQVTLTNIEGLVYATEVSAKYSSLQLSTGSATNTLNNSSTNLISLWNGASGTGFVSGAGGTGVVTAQTLATSSTAGGYAAANLRLAGTGYSNAITGNITVTATNAAAGSNAGITQTGAIAMNSNGGNISFSSNNSINQTGAITIVPNTSGAASSVTYDTTAGDKTSSIVTGALNAASGSVSAINYVLKTSGAPITPDAISVPGSIYIDNTYLGGVSRGINLSNAATKATALAGITLSKNLTAGLYAGSTGITIVGINSGSTTAVYDNSVTISAQTLAGPINITGYSIGAGASVHTTGLSLNSANGINVNAYGTTGGPVNGLYMATGTITNAAGDINFFSNQTNPSSTYGINVNHNIVQNANGGNVSFIANNSINQTGTVTITANTTGTVSAITYDTTAGNKASNITAGALTITAGSNTSINYLIKTAGAGITTNGALSLPGSITLDNTYGCTGTNCTPTTGFITTANAATLATTTLSGVSVTGALLAYNLSSATNAITIKGVSAYANTSYSGVSITAAVTSSNGNISITGIASSGAYGVYDSGGVITSAGSVTITGVSTTAQAVNTDSAINAAAGITINANASTATTISTVNILNNSVTMASGVYLSTAVLTPTFMGYVSSSSSGIPVPTSANMIGGAVTGTIAATNIVLQSSTATSATYLFAHKSADNFEKMAQVVFTRVGDSIYAYESAAKYVSTTVALTNAQILTQWTTATNSIAGSAGYGLQSLVIPTFATGDITVTANNTAGGSNTGITQSGAVTQQTNGGNVSFISNNKINQTGAVSFVANTSGTTGNLIYDTSRGTNLSTIVTGTLTVPSGSTSDIDLTIKAAGANINPAAIGTSTIAWPGNVTIDNTYGCSGTGCTPVSGFITASNLATLSTTNYGVLVNNAIYANKTITINAVNNGGNNAMLAQAAMVSNAGDITITATGTTSYVLGNVIANVAWYTAPLTANNGTIRLTGTATTGSGILYGNGSGNMSAKAITIVGTTASGSYGAWIGNMTIVAGGTDISVTGNVGTATNNGIYQTGAIATASGSNITFNANGLINQTGAISLAANTSGATANVTYDTTRGTKASTITSGALTITTGSTSDINFTMKAAGSYLNPAAIGTSTVSLPGTVTVDNTYGGTAGAGGTPTSGFISASNLTTLSTTNYGVLINNAIYANKTVTINTVNNGGNPALLMQSPTTTATGNINITATGTTGWVLTNGINGTGWYNGPLTANNGTINLTAYATTGSAVMMGNTTNGELSAKVINVTGTTQSGTYATYLANLTIVAGGSNLVVNGTNVTNGGAANNGIYQAGAITINGSGSNVSFTSNGGINQTGAIARAANTSGSVANIIYDTTSGSKSTPIVSGALTITTGSTSDINFTMKSVGANINPGVIGSTTVALPGTVTLDSSYGCTGTGCTPASGFVTAANLATYATTSAGVTINSVIYSNKAITVKGISNGAQGIVSSAIVKANTGNINFYGIGVAHRGIEYSADITALAGNVVMTGITNSNYGIYTSNASLIQANNITLNGSATAAWNGWLVQAGAFTINSTAVGGSISVTATGVTAGASNGLYQSGAIALASGSNMTFTTNNTLSQNGAIAVAANGSGVAANLIYDTTSGTKVSTIISGTITITTGSTSDINLTMKSAGANINPGVIGSTTVSLPGNVNLDNTYGCTGTSCTPATGFVTAANAATYATTSAGVTLNQVIYATKDITVKGTASANQGVNYSAIIKTTGGNVAITGSTTTNYGVYNSAASLITANNITITGYASGTVNGYLAQVGPMTINSTFANGSIAVTGMNATAGGGNGIYQSGAITGANGTNISFVSNNKINQAGAITLVANTSSAVANIVYDTTSGTKLSDILGVDISVPAGSTKAVNYTMKSAGAQLDPVVSVPGAIVLDNTYGCTGAGCTPVSGFINMDNAATLATASDAVVVGALTAGTGITLRGISSALRGVASTAAMNSTAGDITIVGYTTAAGQRAVDFAVASSVYAAGGSISITGGKNVAATLTTLYLVGTSTAAPLVLSASGNIDIVGYALSSNTAVTYGSNILLVAGGNVTISGTGAGGTTYGAVDLTPAVIKAGGNLTIQGSNKINGEAVGAVGSSAIGVGYGVNITSSTSMTIAAGKVNAGTYGNINATGTTSIDATATGNSGTAFNATTGNLSSGGLMTIIGRAVTGTGIIGVNTTATTALSSAGGIAISGIGSVGGTTGNIAMLGSITNTGTTGTGITISSTYNTSVANVTNSGTDGMRITGGAGIAAGTTTGGTITGLGTLTNTGGVMALSMAQPGATAYTLEGKIGLTTSNASTANVRYSVAGGNFTNPSSYSSGNFINYRSAIATYTVSATIGNYSATYGTAYDGTSALNWLRTGSNVTLSASGLPFGILASDLKAGLVWNSTIGASAINANAVQAATALNAGSIKTADGMNVTIASGTPTYTITKANLTITNNASTSTYDGTSTYANLVSTAGYTVTGLVASIGGVSTGDSVTSVTQTIKSGATVGSGIAASGVAQAGSFNAVPSVALGVGLANYNITYTGIASTVSQAAITITASNDSKVYGNTTSGLGYSYVTASATSTTTASGGVGYSITSGQLIGSDAITGLTLTSVGGVATSGVGTYTITPSGATGIGNYNITYATGTMTVTAKPITVTANNVTTTYGTAVTLGSSANFTKSATLVGTDSMTAVTLSYNSGSSIPGTVNAGSYSGVITPSAAVGTGLANYTITYATGNLVVNQKALTVSLNTQTKVYDANAFATLTSGSYALSGFATGESATINQTVGTYNSANVASATTVTAALTSSSYVAASGTLLSNYVLPTTASTTVGGGTITPATLTIIADSQAKFVGQSDPSFTYTYSGLKGADTLSTAAGTVSLAANRTTSVSIRATDGTLTLGVMPAAGAEVGGKTYLAVIVPSASALSSNYTLNAVGGDYSIAAAGQLIVKIADTIVSYGTYSNSTNLATAISNSVTGLYCKIGSTCGGVGDIQTLSNTSVTSAGTNIATFVAQDSVASQGVIQFTVALDSSATAASYSTGGFLNVGAYTMKPSSVTPVANSSNVVQVNYIRNDPAYPVIYTAGKVTVTPITVTVSNGSAPTKQYDTTTSMSGVVITPTNKQTGDVLGLSGFGAFGSANAGSNLNYTINNIQLSGADAANYVLASTSISGTNGTITKAPVTISGLAASNKVYDANNTATLTGTASVFGLLGSDTSTLTGSATATFNSVNVANSIAVTPTLSGLTLGNANYQISGVTSALTANITPAPITVTAAKVYDGSLSVANAGLTVTGVAGQTLSFGAATTATLTNPNVNSASFSTLNSATLANGTTGTVGLASNYTLVNPIYSTVTITPASITVSASNAVKTYDTNTGVVGATTAPAATLVSGTLYTNAATGLLDSLSGGVFTYSNANAGTGNKTLQVASVSVLNGTVGASANYSITYQDNTTSTINQKSVTVSGLSAANKVYNGTAAAVISGTPTVNGLLGSDTASVIGTITSGTFADANVANNISVNLVLSGLSLNNANYVISGTTSGLIANITPVTVTLSASKVYDGTNALTGSQVTIGGLVGSQTLTYNTATVDNLNAGSSFINGITLANGTNGGLASNYALPSLTTASASNTVTITKAALVVTADNKSMTYGDSTLPTLAATITGYVHGETSAVLTGAPSLSTTATAYNGTAGSGSVVGSYTITAAVGSLAADNYSLSFTAGTLVVNKANLTITASADSKVYGSTTTAAGVAYVSGVATGATAGFTNAGLVNGDTLSSVTLTSLGGNATANVVDGPFTITPSAAAGSARTTSSNYTITYVPATNALTVTPKEVSFTGSATKTYDGSTALSGVSVSTGVGSETLLLSNATANSADVGSGNFISAGTLVNGTGANGGLASNYTLPTTLNASTAPFNITKAVLTVTADNKTITYGDSSLPSLTATITGYVNGETSAVLTGAAGLSTSATAYNGTAGSASVVGNYAITPAVGTLSATNYSFSYVAGSLTVNKAIITITAADDTKVYGSTTTAAGVAYVSGVATGATLGFTNSALVNGDTLSSVTLTSTGGNTTANVVGGPYTITPSAAAGSARTTTSNYEIRYVAATNGLSVTPLTVTLNGTTATKTYDGTTSLTGNQITISGLIGGQTLTYTGATANSANVGAGNYINAMTLADGTGLSSNYALPTLNATNAPVTIAPKAVSIAGVKTYDATTGFTGSQVTITGMVGTETLTFTGAAANDANVATANKYFSAITLADGTNGGLASNYALPSLTAVSARNTVTINPLTVSLNSSTATKVYDGTTTLTGGDITISGLIGGQTLTYTGATANSANVGSGNYITGMTLANGTGLASNYALPTLNATNAPVDISKANLSAVGSRVYDGTVSFLGGNLTITGVNGETFTASGEGVLSAKDVQTNQTLASVRGLVLSGVAGSLVTNYNDLATAQTSVSVTVRSITLAAPAITKVYDGGFAYSLNAADLAAMNPQLVGTDTFSAATAIYVGNDANVGATKAITLSAVTISDGNNGANYNVAFTNSVGAITTASLLVTAANDAKFVSQVDNSAYAGALYTGFVNGETASNLGGALVITRTNASVNAVGSYAGVLQPSGLTSSNYQITYATGSYTIVAAENLLIRATETTTYGTAPSYSFTAQYLAADNTTLSYIGFAGTSPNNNPINLSVVANRSGLASFTLDDGGSTANLAISPSNATLSGSSNINVGQYNIADATPTFNVSTSFKGVTVIGQLTVTPMTITAPVLGTNSITKVYDGNAVISANAINTSSSSSQLLAGDLAAITATGVYADKNVANAKTVTVNFALTGADAANYVMSAPQMTGAYGQITQLNSVTYVGASGGNWSTASNWAGGAIPDYSNVANVIIPTNKTVNFDSSVGGPMTSAIQNNGVLNFNLSADTAFANNITGAGALTISNAGVITLSGNNTYAGGTTLNAGASLVAASNNAIGTGGITSNGTANNPAMFATGNSVVLPSLAITGGATKLMSSITTVGAQSYADLILGVSGTTTLASSNANISLLGKVDSAVNKTNDLVINAGTANVTIGDSIGSVARFNNLTVTGRAIYILADILTGMTQTYNGSVLIGDASFLGKTPTVGFLLSNYRSYFEYTANGRSSVIDYLNLNPIYIRTLISVDPEITFNGTVNDVVANTHTLLTAAIAPTSPAANPAALNTAAVINFNDSVGQEAPLYSVNVQTVLNSSQNNSAAYLGSINLTGNVATYSSQTYRANMMTAKSNPQPGEVVFSVWDPAASVTYLLPLQDATNSNCSSNCGQMNLQNPNSVDAIKFNGSNNFIAARNSTGVNNWGTRFTQANALGYVAPPARSNSEFMNYAKFIQRDVQHRIVKPIDDGDERKATVSVGEAQVDGSSVDCSALRKDPKAVLPPECRIDRD